jgi:hypothetical protein
MGGYDLSKPDQEVKEIPVVVDPTLAKILRPHQVEGVKFMYDALSGAIVEGATGNSNSICDVLSSFPEAAYNKVVLWLTKWGLVKPYNVCPCLL